MPQILLIGCVIVVKMFKDLSIEHSDPEKTLKFIIVVLLLNSLIGFLEVCDPVRSL